MPIPTVSSACRVAIGHTLASPPWVPIVRWMRIAAVLDVMTGMGSVEATRAADAAAVSDVECGILLPGILPEGQVVPTIGRLVIAPSGTATLTCRGTLDPALAPARTVVITDVPCALGEGGTVGESHTQVSPSGEVLLVCHNNPGSEPLPPSDGD